MANESAENAAFKAAKHFLKTLALGAPPKSLRVLLDLSPAQTEEMRACVGQLVRTIGKRHPVSKKEIEDALLTACRNAVGKLTESGPPPKVRAQAAFAGLKAQITQPTSVWRVAEAHDAIFTPERFKIGHVLVSPMPKELSSLRKEIGHSPRISDQEFDDLTLSFTSKRTLLVATVRAVDAHAADEIGRLAIEAVIGCLRLLDGQKPDVVRERMVAVGSKKLYRFLMLQPTLVRASNIKRIRNDIEPAAFAALSRVLRTRNPTEMEERLLLALRWCGHAANSVDPNVAVLQYAIALETAIGRKHSAKDELAYRAAWLFKLRADRAIVARNVGLLFADRNDIAHGGKAHNTNIHRRLANELLMQVLCRLALRSRLCAMSADQFNQYWAQHRIA